MDWFAPNPPPASTTAWQLIFCSPPEVTAMTPATSPSSSRRISEVSTSYITGILSSSTLLSRRLITASPALLSSDGLWVLGSVEPLSWEIMESSRPMPDSHSRDSFADSDK